ncbi:MAG: ankyrin repeat domain-containing protein, partial [Bdellovibrionales bacterium]
AGADANGQDYEWKRTALMYAASSNKTEIVKLLLQAGANVNGQDSDGRTALMYAASSDKLTYIITNEKRKHESIEFYISSDKTENKTEIVKLLLQAGANVNARDNKYRTALTIAYRTHDEKGFLDAMLSKKDYKNTVQALKQAGATE